MTTLWDTTGTAVVQALAAERRSGGAVTSGLALTLVVVLEEKDTAVVEAAVATAAAKHPMRVIMVLRHHIDAPVPRLDAEVSIGGRHGPGEAVVLRMFGRLALHAESVTLPLLAPDAPVVAWWYSETPQVIAHDPLGVFADRRITNVIRDADPAASLRQRAVDFAPGDTDLTWTVITPWRAALAAAFDTASAPAKKVVVTGNPADPSAQLLAGWLTSRLGITVPVEKAEGKYIVAVGIEFSDGRTVQMTNEGYKLLMRRPGQLDTIQPFPQRTTGDMLAEELRRLDADQPYGEALGAVTDMTGLNDRPPVRTHIWHDPALASQDLAQVPAQPELIVQPTAEQLAADVAVRVMSTLARAQQNRGRAALALTAGSIMEQVWSAMAATPARDSVDWSRVNVFWADERYVPADSSDRNDGPADRLLFSRPPFSGARRFPMPASDSGYGTLDDAAAGYADQLAAAGPDDPDELPHFDVLLLGVGPDGHCASLFPEHPSAYDESGPVIAVRNFPKPPPLRISLSFGGLAAANEIWFVASGAGKSRAVALALSGAGRVQVPSAGPRGRFRTLWLVDREAAAGLPRHPDGRPIL